MLIKYLKSHMKSLVMLTVFGLITMLVFALFDLSVIPVVYAALICAAVGIPVLAYDFYRYINRHKAMLQVLDSETTEEVELPETRSAIETDYAQLVRRLCAENTSLRMDYSRKITETDDYYTLWAHQIKTPIAAMSLLLQSDGETDTAALRGELFKIERYVELVLQYLRLDSIVSDLKLQEVKLDSAVKQSVKKYATLFIRSRLSLSTDSESLDTIVISDEKWLCFMIEQIISNAIKYTPSGSISIYREGQNLCIEDTGIGISAEDLPRIFDRGFTGCNGRKDKKSTGLGLYLCARVAEKLAIRLHAESKPGSGTRIIMTFPDEKTVFE